MLILASANMPKEHPRPKNQEPTFVNRPIGMITARLPAMQGPNWDVPHAQGEGDAMARPMEKARGKRPKGAPLNATQGRGSSVAAPLKSFVWCCWGGLLFHATCMPVAPLLVSSLGAHRIAPCCVPKHLASSTRVQKDVHAIGLGIGAYHAEK